MKTLNFAKRNYKEIIRDPLSIIFSILLPVFLLFIFQQFDIPNEAFLLENFTPGIVIFSFSFITLFMATLVAKDRSTSLLTRLGTSPMRARDYILGYTVSILPIILLQNTIFFIAAILLGLPFSIHILFTVLASIPISILFIALGILIGCVTTEKSAAGVSSIIVQLVAFTSGMYFPAELAGEVFNTICNILPFSRCVAIVKGILNHDYQDMGSMVFILFLYTLLIVWLAIFVFKRKMVSDNR